MNQQNGTSAVIWLARREIRRLWSSYLLTGLFMLFMGFLAASVFETGALGPTEALDQRDAVLADVVILLLATLLATNYTLWGSYANWSSPAERKLAFMRMLPIPASTIVGSRMVSMIFPLLYTVPAFFLPTYLLADLRIGLSDYLAFVVFWIGYALIWAGLNMYVELVGGSRFFFWISFVLAGAMIGLILVITVGFEVQIISAVADLSASYGLLSAPVALVIGAAVFMLAGRITERGLLEREIAV